MPNNIDTLRIVGNKLAPFAALEGQIKISDPQMIIPGAQPATDVDISLETKKGKADVIIQKGGTEVQRAMYEYARTPDGYELVSAMSAYCADDKKNKEVRQNRYFIESGDEMSYEQCINYANAPLKENTREYINEINSSFAQAVGYKSSKIDYDKQEHHTYGKKSLNRDIPALLKVVDVIAPDSEITLKMKDKLKKDNKTSLVAFEVNDTVNGNEIARGFMSTDGDSVSYHIDTDDMVIVGEQGRDKNISKAYLKREKAVDESKIIKEEVPEEVIEKELPKEISVEDSTVPIIPVTEAPEPKKSRKKPKQTVVVEDAEKPKKTHTKSPVVETPKKGTRKTGSSTSATTIEPKQQIITNGKNHVYSTEYYANIILETSMSNDIERSRKIDLYQNILATAYMDGYSRNVLRKILSVDGLCDFSPTCQDQYVNKAIELAQAGKIKRPVKTWETKIEELKKTEIDIDDEELKMCFLSMVSEIAKVEDVALKESFADQALTLLRDSGTRDLEADLLSFIEQYSVQSEDLMIHYDIYKETVNNVKIKNLKDHILQMINNIDDTTYHDKRTGFSSRLYTTSSQKDLEDLQNEIQILLNKQFCQQETEEIAVPEKIQLPIESLSNGNQKIVVKLLNCKSPKKMSMTYETAKHLLLDMGFKEVKTQGGSDHHKFNPPLDLYINGVKQNFVTLISGAKTIQPAEVEILIHICEQYYGTEEE